MASKIHRIRALPVQEQENGQSLTELAVSLVVLLIILAGMVDLGRLFFVYIGMRDAAQEGVVYAITEPAQCSEIEARALNLLTDTTGMQISIRMNGVDCFAAQPQDACGGGKTVEVTVIDPNFRLSMPFVGSILGKQTLQLKAGVTGTVLRPQCP